MSDSGRPTIVCLCGSTRFGQAFRDANLRETLAGRIVLSIGCDMRADDDVFGSMSEDERAATKAALDALHLHKVELADEVLILNVGGYIGESTARELAHARAIGKAVRFLEPPADAPVVREILEIRDVHFSFNPDGPGIGGHIVDEIVRRRGPDGGAGAAAVRVRR